MASSSLGIIYGGVTTPEALVLFSTPPRRSTYRGIHEQAIGKTLFKTFSTHQPAQEPAQNVTRAMAAIDRVSGPIWKSVLVQLKGSPEFSLILRR
ncbi:hypothetical protein N7491_009444 [Penicillium cf. griseofulvum]|uniref:Uncharacterized protein n=1 Tax=Penicillium cf. griseofulvum TaxID=2972120 RepID=A0A9W9JMQ5_9EURO|nr:hypothetical protein N7472_004964 [Penicillium cf. griseofulvum]KAJ5424228.1 hypothetical protein N7491_009444 [Penicillium cf. griseofulvum]KAJ5442533.1 hypothetical protein N7445_005540 [Penicillium cf. griseofulvum]